MIAMLKREMARQNGTKCCYTKWGILVSHHGTADFHTKYAKL